MLLNERRFSDALAQADVALDFEPTAIDAKLLRSQVLIGLGRYADASEELESYLKQKPDDFGAKLLAERCKQVSKENSAELLALADELNRQRIFAVAGEVTNQAGKLVKSRNELLPTYRKRIEAAWPGLGGRLGIRNEGFSLHLVGHKEVSDLTPLKGIPVVDLNLGDCPGVRDLTPLVGMPLKELSLANTSVRDLTPLTAMRPTSLSVYGTKVRDLSPLRDMPLKSLNLSNCRELRDLEPIKAMPLTTLHIVESGVRDLIPLNGMALTEIFLTPKNIKSGMQVLRQMKSLRVIGVGLVFEGKAKFSPDQFWKKYDAGEFGK